MNTACPQCGNNLDDGRRQRKNFCPTCGMRLGWNGMDVPGATRLWHRPWVVGLLLMTCFPLGLFLVWRNPHWSRNRRLAWTGAFAAVLLVGVVLAKQEEVAARLAHADLLWESGARAEAVDTYGVIVSRDVEFVYDIDRPAVYRRLIDFEAEHGDTDEARRLIRQALDQGVMVSVHSSEAAALMKEEGRRRSIGR